VANRWYGFVGSFVVGVAMCVALRPAPAADLEQMAPWLGWISGAQLSAGLLLLGGLIAAAAFNKRFDSTFKIVACGLSVAFIVTGAGGLQLARYAQDLRTWAGHPWCAKGEKAVYTGRVVGGPDLGPRGSTLDVRLLTVDGQRLGRNIPSVPPASIARVFLPRNTGDEGSMPAPYVGDVIEFYGALETYPPQMLPGGWNGRQRMLRHGIILRSVARGPWERIDGAAVTRPIRRSLDRLRVGFQRRVLASVSRPEAGVIVALITGNRQFLRDDIEEAFRETGTGHLLAISGIHLAVLAGGLWWFSAHMCRLIPSLTARYGRKRITGLGVLVGLGLYVVAIGAPTSAVRAFMMIAAVVGAHLLYRPGSGLSGLALAALVILAWRPGTVGDLGFQFSFAATGAILLFLTRMPGVLQRPSTTPFARPSATPTWLRYAGQSVGVSVVASLAIWPVTLSHFGTVSLAGIPVNILVTPLVSASVFPCAFLGSAVSAVAPTIGGAILWWAGHAMVRLASLLEPIGLMAGATAVPGVPSWWATVTVSLGVAILTVSRWRSRPLLIGSLLMTAGVLVTELEYRRSPDALTVDVLPVGQGESVVVRSPGGDVMLIDAGGSRFGRDPGRSVVVPYLRRQGVSSIDWVVATHADVDHVGGLEAVVEYLQPRRIVVDGTERSDLIGQLVEQVRTGGGTALQVAPGQHIRFDLGGAVATIGRADPDPASAGHWALSDNNASLVTTLEYAGRRLMITGDIERASERWFAPLLPPVDWMTVPHHGSTTSSSPALLDALQPKVAVVSAGRDSPFGHPDLTILRRYESRRIPVLQTALTGLVRTSVGSTGRWTVQSHLSGHHFYFGPRSR
jgi:competence protein ComEC